MSTLLVPRAQWNARAPKGETHLALPPKGVKYHWVGGRVDPDLVRNHRLCVDLVKGIQRQHMDVNHWGDIGYTCLVCAHRQIFVGRGPGILPAANGAGLNAGHYAIMAMVGDEGLVEPPPLMLHGLVDAREWLQGVRPGLMPCGPEIKGHRDGYATDCPGGWLYGWVRRGAPRPDDGTEPTPPKVVPPPWPGRVLEYPPVMEGEDVRTWQAQMKRRGWRITVDGAYGPESREIARAFQAEKGLKATGKIRRDDWDMAWAAPIT